MDDTELTYRFWRIRKTVMQVCFALFGGSSVEKSLVNVLNYFEEELDFSVK